MAEAVDSTEVQQPAAAGDEDDRKLFVGGLPQDASQVFQFPQYQCSGSGIWCLFDPGIRDGKKTGSGSRVNNPDHISESLETIFWVKILKFFDADPG
jgi:hypothetical protein